MYLAYVDESGDPGASGSRTYSLGCVVVDAEAWPSVFDQVLDHRRFLRDNFRIPVRAELKANYLVRNSGPLAPLRLGDGMRYRIYRGLMRLQPKLGLRTFAVVINKPLLTANGALDPPRDLAWIYLLQRLERMTTNERRPLLLVHDEGETLLIRKMARKARRAGGAGSFYGTGYLRRPFKRLIDDPVPRHSHHSFFIQFADLAAYAAYRFVYPPPPGPTPRIVPQGMWAELGDARFAPVSRLTGGPQGLVIYPTTT